MIATGTSGFNYPEWEGRFYPERLPAGEMLAYYAARFPTVEINYTFYRMPTEPLLAGWAAQVPEHFTFTLKAPRRITHDRRLKDVADPTAAFCRTAATLGARLALLLFQLPPNLKCDLGLLEAFLDTLPPRVRAAFEFRHDSWFSDSVYERLDARRLALCVADSETRHTPMVATAEYGYVRLRDEGYADADLAAWASRIAAETRWRDAYVYFKHEDEGKGPEFARAFMGHLAALSPVPSPDGTSGSFHAGRDAG
jgi:uncharacterized protein YecE (DUF72 family)